MTRERESEAGLRRIPSGIAGLDEILSGGFLEGGAYIVKGLPGTGKTTLVNQVAFSHVGRGGRALYVTLLSEQHARLMQHMQLFDFFAAEAIPERLAFLSAFRTLEAEGLAGVMTLLRGEMAAHRASLLVIDGMLAVSEQELSDRDLRKFVHELQGHMGAAGCTGLITTNEGRSAYHPEYTIVDGVLTLEHAVFGARTQRQLQVEKLRGTGYLPGKHAFTITDAGLTVYPRTEALLTRPQRDDDRLGERLSCGIPALDAMMHGGVPSATTTLLLGPSGVGKTMIGLHFACAASAREPALFFTFYETPERLLMKARRVHLGFETAVRKGHLEVLWQPPAENLLDALTGRLLDAVDRLGARRLFIDGMGGFQQAAVHPDRLPNYFGTLANALRLRGVTTILTGETQVIIGSEVRSPVPTLSILAENMLLMRYVELRSRLYRVLSILEMRDTGFDPSLYEFELSERGVSLSPTPESAEALLDAMAGRAPSQAHGGAAAEPGSAKLAARGRSPQTSKRKGSKREPEKRKGDRKKRT